MIRLRLLDRARHWLKALEENTPEMQELVELMLKKSNEMHTFAEQMQSSKFNTGSSTSQLSRQMHRRAAADIGSRAAQGAQARPTSSPSYEWLAGSLKMFEHLQTASQPLIAI